jgi:hypothetical protein
MGFTTLQNTPITIDLLLQGNSRGWSIDGDSAIHETCNSGDIELINYPITAGVQYQLSYTIDYINSGNLRAILGGTNGTLRTTAGFFTETITATDNTNLRFFSNANAKLSPITIKVITNVFNEKSTNTIAWSEKFNKWASFRGYSPDTGFSLFANLFMHLNGQAWISSVNATRNSFFGQQYKSILNFAAAAQEGVPKTFESISIDANRLMITTTDGIKTSLGQVSELIDIDFLKDTLDDGVNQVNIYDVEGIYSAGFMRDKNDDIVNGSVLKGTYITIELITTDTGVLKLSNVLVNSVNSKIGAR